MNILRDTENQCAAMLYKKEDLIGNSYTWANAADESIFTGSPSRRLFDRFNGNQVLLIINSFAQETGRQTLDDSRKMEQLLQNELPVELRSEMAVIAWLRQHYPY